MQQTKAYEKVIEHIKKQIINHDLTIGEKLPPEREISEQLGVSRNSVREAIHMLEMMGFISSQQEREIMFPVILKKPCRINVHDVYSA